jgi:hypothetical protein
MYLYLVKKVRRGGDILQFQVYSRGRGTDDNVETVLTEGVKKFGVSEIERTQLCLERNKNTKRREELGGKAWRWSRRGILI